MNKKLVIYISCGILVAVIIGVALYFIITNNDNNKVNSDIEYDTKKVIIEKYENYETIKTTEVTKKKQVKELIQICDNVSLEQDEYTKELAIKKDIKIDLNNGVLFYIQLELTDYCYIEDTNSNIKAVIKMPEGLYEYVQGILQENN